MTAEATSRVNSRAIRTMPGRGNWWIQPVAIAVGFTLFVIYSFWTVAFGVPHHTAGPYLSPFYSPVLKFGWWPLSSAFLVTWVPLGFRTTCYYYRKAYYRSFFLDPPACAITEPGIRRHYSGETRFPLILNNFHRYFLYVALVVLGFLWYDTANAFYYHGGFYIGGGSVLMLANVCLLTVYTCSCHALRHFVGGSVNCFSCVLGGGARRGLWGLVSKINPYHGSFAWFSLVSVVAVDVYIRIVSSIGGCFGVHAGC